MKSVRLVWVLGFFLAALPAHAIDFLPDFGMDGGKHLDLHYTGAVEPKDGARIEKESGIATVPIFQDSTDSLSMSAYTRWLGVESGLTLPSGTGVPKDLWDEGGGLSYLHQLPKNRSWMTSATFGSTSDHPFSQTNVETVSATAGYSFAGDDDHPMLSRWLLLVNYSNNRPFLNNIPLPGVVYFYNPDQDTHWVFGFPFSALRAKLGPRWSLTAFAVIPWILKAELAYSLHPGKLIGPELTLGADFNQQPFLLQGRTDPKERLFYNERQLYVGARAPLFGPINVELMIGEAFNRSFYQAENFSAKNVTDKTNLGNSFFASWSLGARF